MCGLRCLKMIVRICAKAKVRAMVREVRSAGSAVVPLLRRSGAGERCVVDGHGFAAFRARPEACRTVGRCPGVFLPWPSA